jgi:amidohydrolase
MDLLEEARDLFPFTQMMRRDFHQHPEIGFEEVRTSAIVSERLKEFGLEVRTGIGKTGVIGLLEGADPGPVLLLRFDMDALPIQEENEAPYASQNSAKMHACGHDAHTAIGLSVAKLLSMHKDQVRGTIKFVFQPAEEGQGGAEAMVRDGVLENPIPNFSMGVHVWNEKPVGWFGISKGAVMASADIFSVKVIGEGGHGAVPHATVDPILAAAQMITSLQSIVSRNVPPLESAVVSVTHIAGGAAFNIIPQSVTFEGTIRSFLPEVHEILLSRFNQITTGVANAFGCHAEIMVRPVTLPVINDPKLAETMIATAYNLFKNAQVDPNYRTMGSEDMSFLMHDIPGCFILIGSANEEKGLTYGHHHPHFDIDEACLPHAVALLAQGSLNILKTFAKD